MPPHAVYIESHLGGGAVITHKREAKRNIGIEIDPQTGMATEWVWLNYPTPTQLHDYRYLGNDFRKREKIKLRFKTKVERFKRLSPIEQQALLFALNKINSDSKEGASINA